MPSSQCSDARGSPSSVATGRSWMLTDRQLTQLLRSLDADVLPDPAFEARLLAIVHDARSHRPARLRWALGSAFARVPAWVVVARLTLALALAGIIAGGHRA